MSMTLEEAREGRPAVACLAEELARLQTSDGVREILPGVWISRSSTTFSGAFGIYTPALCLVAQGAKEAYVGDLRLRYDASRYLVVSADVPMTGTIMAAGPERPFLSVLVTLDRALVTSVVMDSGMSMRARPDGSSVLATSGVTSELLDAVLRLLRSAGRPLDSRLLAPLYQREIVTLLLMGPEGHRLRYAANLSGDSPAIMQALDRLRTGYHRSISIEGLAKDLGMSPSTLYHNFRTLTNMSPLQYLKQIRLQEARRLMLEGLADASGAACRVGYENASHFSRDYKRFFGDSPIRDVERLRSMMGPG